MKGVRWNTYEVTLWSHTLASLLAFPKIFKFERKLPIWCDYLSIWYRLGADSGRERVKEIRTSARTCKIQQLIT